MKKYLPFRANSIFPLNNTCPFIEREHNVAKKADDDVWRRSRDDEREEEEGWTEILCGI